MGVSDLWLLLCAPCWTWGRVSLETDSEFRCSGTGHKTGVRQPQSLLIFINFCFLRLSVLCCASGHLSDGKNLSSNVWSKPQAALSATEKTDSIKKQVLLWAHSKTMLCHYNTVVYSVFFYSMVQGSKSEMWRIVTFIFSTAVAGNHCRHMW